MKYKEFDEANQLHKKIEDLQSLVDLLSCKTTVIAKIEGKGVNTIDIDLLPMIRKKSFHFVSTYDLDEEDIHFMLDYFKKKLKRKESEFEKL